MILIRERVMKYKKETYLLYQPRQEVNKKNYKTQFIIGTLHPLSHVPSQDIDISFVIS